MKQAQIDKAHEIVHSLRKNNATLNIQDISGILRILGYDLPHKTVQAWYYEAEAL
ncbi:MAG: hypothetical protein GOVbin1578_17 [Prokaryotic dsDNA virus sp.]|nr:MAG: hypothetical protein GOVbin1578_17 [Prokaryotic dsDNA virus sp.]|tara:strand:- start:2690 stop:2854 length:165 start_codon:yes stop_codon:yes gene_type:complete